ncbi:MAG TPA: hypothetical protein VJS92_02625 [Candidatus Polarisedimenticolaceae bacterium]|nr:hypothetical protein [Candidatus Polarisedimenticolaceae bacterium]
MKNVRRMAFGMVALALAATLSMPSFAGPAMVGDFVRAIASAKSLPAGDVRLAVDSLASRGVRLPADLDLAAPLTEGAVQKIARAAGINVTTSNPQASFTSEQVGRFVLAFGTELGARNGSGDNATRDAGCGNPDCPGNGPSFDPFTKGKGKHKGKGKGLETPSDPE